MTLMNKLFFILLFFFSYLNTGCYVIDLPDVKKNNSHKIAEIKKWKNGIVYYYFLENNFSYQEKENIKKAMQIWETSTIISFVEEETKNSLKIIKSEKITYASIGCQKDNFLYLPAVCGQRIILHELGHVLGLRHEHQRNDRDLYISILWDNIIPEKKREFEIIQFELYDFSKYEYDFNSIMHYSFYDFSKNYNPTIKYVDKDGFYLVRLKPSYIDFKKINDIYHL